VTTIAELLDPGQLAALLALVPGTESAHGVSKLAEDDEPMTTVAPALARCTGDRACAVRFTSGPDRPCLDHDRAGAGTDLAARLAELGMAAPGDYGKDDGAQ